MSSSYGSQLPSEWVIQDSKTQSWKSHTVVSAISYLFHRSIPFTVGGGSAWSWRPGGRGYLEGWLPEEVLSTTLMLRTERTPTCCFPLPAGWNETTLRASWDAHVKGRRTSIRLGPEWLHGGEYPVDSFTCWALVSEQEIKFCCIWAFVQFQVYLVQQLVHPKQRTSHAVSHHSAFYWSKVKHHRMLREWGDCLYHIPLSCGAF